MKHSRRISLFLAVLLLTSCLALPAKAEEGVDWQQLWAYSPASAEAQSHVQVRRGALCLFLPAGLDVTELCLRLPSGVSRLTVSGSGGSLSAEQEEPADWSALLTGQETELEVSAETENGAVCQTLTVYRSGGVEALYFFSDNPDEQGRLWVEASRTKENRASGRMLMLTPDGTVEHADKVEAIKGRGNTTWSLPKRPYQLKLAKKDDLLDTGNPDNKAKKWLLIANYQDRTLMRNRLAYALGGALGMDCSIETRAIDLFYDGEYRGSYLLTEKVEVGAGRVGICDLEKENEKANPDVAPELLPAASGRTENGACYRCRAEMNTPEDSSGGYLLEMDFAPRALEEASYFRTRRGYYVTVKSPEYCSREEMDYIASWYQEFEDALFAGGVNPQTGRRYTEYVDLESMAAVYLVNELAKNNDGYGTSTYLYLDRDAETAKMGPLWDYDIGFGRYAAHDEPSLYNDPTGMYTVHGVFVNHLYRQQDFREAVQNLYAERMYPALTQTLLGDETASDGDLQSLQGMRAALRESAFCNAVLWAPVGGISLWEDQTARLETYLRGRAEYLQAALADWNEVSESLGVFLDVPVRSWYAQEVWTAAELGLVRGTSPVFFSPEQTATRVQAIQIMFNLLLPDYDDPQTPFSDVPPDHDYAVPIGWAASEGIAMGYPDGTFQPNANITRLDLITLLYRMRGDEAPQEDALAAFTDGRTVPAYGRDAMNWAIAEGLIQGFGDGTLRPLQITNRAELAAILLRYSRLPQAQQPEPSEP